MTRKRVARRGGKVSFGEVKGGGKGRTVRRAGRRAVVARESIVE